MAGISRRAWLATLGLAPVAGGLAAWAENEKKKSQERIRKTHEDPRDMVRERHFPNTELITHNGRRVLFYDDLIKDKKVILNFMYAQCKGICIPVTTNLVRVQKLLKERGRLDIFFYSITLKPEDDTPEVLRHYAEMHGVGPGWLFLTGKPEDIEMLRRRQRFVDVDPAVDADKSSHIGMIRYGNEPMVRWAACPGLADPGHIVRTLLWDLG